MQCPMSVRPAIRMTLLTALCAAGLSACSESPTERVASAQKFLDKNDVNAASIELKSALQKDPKLAEARYLLGTVNLQQGDAAGAVKELRRASEFGVPALRVSPVLARALLRQGDVDQVLKEFEGVRVGEAAADAQILATVGYAHLLKGNVDGARAAFDAALTEAPTDPAARAGMGRVKLVKGDLDGALADADAVLAGQPSGSVAADAHALRADVFVARRNTGEAIGALEAAVKAQPDAINYHFSLVSLRLQTGDVEGAATSLAALQKAAPQHPLTRYLQATLDLRKGNLTAARDDIVETVRLAPNYLPGRYLAGLIYARLNEHVVAQEHLNAVVARAPAHAGARLALSRSQLAMNEPERALETIQPLLDAKNRDEETLRLAGQIYAMTGNIQAASRRFAELVAANPEDARARTQLGVTKVLAGQGDSGLGDLEAAAGLESDEGEADIALILTYMGRGDVKKATAAMRELEAKRPKDPKTFMMKGALLLGQKDASAARGAFETALSLKEDYLPAVANLARMDIMEKRPQDAVKRLESFVGKYPANAGGSLMLADLMVQTGAKPEAVREVLERAAQASPAVAAPKLALIEHDLRQRDVKRALTTATQAAAAHPNEARVFGMLGRTHLAANDKTQALAAFAKQVDLAPRAVLPLIELADVQRLSEDNKGAEQSLRRALALRPGNLDVQRRQVALYAAEKRVGDGLAVAREVEKQRPKSAIGWLLEADLHVANKDWEPGIAALKKAYEIEKSAPIVTRLHVVQMEAGKKKDADALASAWLRKMPDDVVVRRYLADRALAEQRLDDAEKIYHEINRIKPDNPTVINNLAWLSGKRGDPQAMALAEHAVSLSPGNAAIVDTLGMLQLEHGQPDKGVENLRRAVSLAPEAPVFRLNLVRAFAKLGRKDEARKEVDLLLQSLPADSPSRQEAVALKESL